MQLICLTSSDESHQSEPVISPETVCMFELHCTVELYMRSRLYNINFRVNRLNSFFFNLRTIIVRVIIVSQNCRNFRRHESPRNGGSGERTLLSTRTVHFRFGTLPTDALPGTPEAEFVLGNRRTLNEMSVLQGLLANRTVQDFCSRWCQRRNRFGGRSIGTRQMRRKFLPDRVHPLPRGFNHRHIVIVDVQIRRGADGEGRCEISVIDLRHRRMTMGWREEFFSVSWFRLISVGALLHLHFGCRSCHLVISLRSRVIRWDLPFQLQMSGRIPERSRRRYYIPVREQELGRGLARCGRLVVDRWYGDEVTIDRLLEEPDRLCQQLAQQAPLLGTGLGQIFQIFETGRDSFPEIPCAVVVHLPGHSRCAAVHGSGTDRVLEEDFQLVLGSGQTRSGVESEYSTFQVVISFETNVEGRGRTEEGQGHGHQRGRQLGRFGSVVGVEGLAIFPVRRDFIGASGWMARRVVIVACQIRGCGSYCSVGNQAEGRRRGDSRSRVRNQRW